MITIKKQKHGIIKTLLIMLIPLSFVLQAKAYFQDLGLGVRPTGMGEAFVSVGDDSNTLLYNVAGLAGLQQQELNFMYSNLLSNLNARLFNGYNDTLGFHNLCGAVPFDRQIGSFGFFWTQFTSAFYKENTVGIGYARHIGKELFDLDEQIALIDAGLNIKSLHWQVSANEYTSSNEVFQNEGLYRQGITADLGVMVKFPGHWNIGLSLENVIPVDVGLTVQEIVPLNVRVGTSYKHYWKKHELNNIDYVLGSTDFTYRNGIADIRAGMEWSFFKYLFNVRMGTTVDQFSFGLGLNTPFQDSPRAASVDYTFVYPYAIKDTFGSHRVSLIVRWGKIPESKIDRHQKFQVENLDIAPESQRAIGTDSTDQAVPFKPVSIKDPKPARNEDGTVGQKNTKE